MWLHREIASLRDFGAKVTPLAGSVVNPEECAQLSARLCPLPCPTGSEFRRTPQLTREAQLIQGQAGCRTRAHRLRFVIQWAGRVLGRRPFPLLIAAVPP